MSQETKKNLTAMRLIPKSICQRFSMLTDIYFKMKYGFQPPIHGSDLVGYEVILDFIKQHELLKVDGDFVEIGTFLGGGAYKLAKFLEKNYSLKKLYVIDIFDYDSDWSINTAGMAMADIYRDLLKKFRGKSQWDIFSDITKDCHNICCLVGDSKKIEIPSSRLSFGFIDGNHNPEYIENDFFLIWDKLTSGGAVAFHDYEWDLPQTTSKIKELINRFRPEIQNTCHNTDHHILFILKR